MALAYNGETITLCGFGFREKDTPHENMQFCPKGSWSERFGIETDFSWVCLRFNCKKMYHHKACYIDARLGYMSVLINCLLDLTSIPRSLAEFVI